MISIHAPLAGRDHQLKCFWLNRIPFQSTRPLRGATSPPPPGPPWSLISIHAPLAGRDDPAGDG